MIQTVAKHRYFIGRRAKQSVKEYTNYVTFRSGRDASKGGRKFFDKKRDEIAATTVQEALKAQDDKFVVAHELILSPGVQSVDSKDYTRDLLEKAPLYKTKEAIEQMRDQTAAKRQRSSFDF